MTFESLISELIIIFPYKVLFSNINDKIHIMIKYLACLIISFLITITIQAQDTLSVAASLIGLTFSTAELDSLQDGVFHNLDNYRQLRGVKIDNSVAPSWHFSPLPYGFTPSPVQHEIDWQIPDNIPVPSSLKDLAFYSLRDLASIIKSQSITSEALTRIFIDRLKMYSDTLQCMVTLTEELAIKQARKADAEIAAGRYRGPLHGIPYGIKDLFAVPGYPTSWGAMPFKTQTFDNSSTVVKKLEEAGAVLIAKLTLGALAMGDVWFGGFTKNPWDLSQGSSGSSAGSASAVVAGLVPFAIGTETWGSIVSPSSRCGATGLRPTFGRVSRAGGMALSWTMDKVGPICRSATDCAMVFDAIRGSDGIDYSVIDAGFNYQSNQSIADFRIGYFQNLFDSSRYNRRNDSLALIRLNDLGVKMEPIDFDLDLPISAISFILTTEAAAAFDELTRSGADDLMVRQIKRAWPNLFRQARFVPAVEYIQANRIRTKLINKLYTLIKDYDVIITPTFSGDQLLATNLTGQPAITLPNGFDEKGRPQSITFLANLFDEHKLLALAEAFQRATNHHDKHPKMFDGHDP